MAKCQLDSLFNSKLHKHSPLKAEYDAIIAKYLDAAFIVRAPLKPKQGHFLPHHLVTKASNTTPVQIVHNASSKQNAT